MNAAVHVSVRIVVSSEGSAREGFASKLSHRVAGRMQCSWAAGLSPPSFPYHGLHTAAHSVHQSEQVRDKRGQVKQKPK